MVIETKQIFIDTSPSHGTQLTLMGPVIVHILKAKVLLCTLQTTCMFMSRISMHEIFKVEDMAHFNYAKGPYCRPPKSIAYFVCSFLIFPQPNPSFSPKRVRTRRVLIAGGKKVLLTLPFLSLFSLDPINLFLKKD
jgi:hypothetical protein